MKFNFSTLIIVFFMLFSCDLIYSQFAQEWVKKYGRSSTTSDNSSSVVVDNSGNIYVAGSSDDLGTSNDMVIIKYNPNGDTLWIRRYDGLSSGYDGCNKIAIDKNGNIYVTGYSVGIGTGNDVTTIKFTSVGSLVWVRTYNGPGNNDDVATAITIDTSNNIYVTGYSVGNGTDYDYVTLKYNTNGSLQWFKRYNGPGNGNDKAREISLDGTGNIYVTGESTGIGTGFDYATIKYNSSGDSLWVKRYNGTGNGEDQAKSIIVDNSNIYVSGYSAGSGTGNDFLTIKYKLNGDSLWVRRYNGPGGGNDQARSLRSDKNGNVFVGGSSLGSGTGNDFAVIKYNSAGDFLWTQRFNYGSNDILSDIIVDSAGSVYATGEVGSSPFFNEYRFGIVKYNSDGNLEWSHVWYGGGSGDYYAYGNSIALYGPHYVYIAGGTRINYQNDWATLKYSQQFKIRCLIEGFYDPGSNLTIADTLKTYLRNTISPYDIVDSAKTKINTSGIGYYSLYNAPYGQYFLVMKHRNSIETWSPATNIFQATSYDFTTTANQAYGNNLKQIDNSPLTFGMYSGDVNQDGAVELTDVLRTYNDAQIGVGGYVQTDLNGDFFVDITDLIIVYNNSQNFVMLIRP